MSNAFAVKTKLLPLRHGGNEVLLVSYPEIEPTSPAATHTAALVEKLVAFATGTVAKNAETELLAAIQSGALFAHKRALYRITVHAEKTAAGTTVTLTATLFAGEERRTERTLTTYWNADETYQQRRPRQKRPLFRRFWVRLRRQKRGKTDKHS